MLLSRVLFSEPESFCHTRCSADPTSTTSGFRFSAAVSASPRYSLLSEVINHRRCRSYQAKLSVGTIAGQNTLYRPYTITDDCREVGKEFYYDLCCFAYAHN